jgi:hypothetical protein
VIRPILFLILVLAAKTAFAEGLTAQDLTYLKSTFGLARDSGAIAELTPNEQNALHSAIDDLKAYPDSRDRQVRSYLHLVYARECKRWAREHPGEPCSPAPDPKARPGKAISDRICADCHLFGTAAAPSFYNMAQGRVFDAHKVSHALKHNKGMLPIKLTPEQLDQLALYINSLRQ